MVIDWGGVMLNHFIPAQVLGDPSLDEAAVMTAIEAMRPPVVAEVPVPAALLRLVEVPSLSSVRRAEILAELAAIDAASARPLRAILVGSATDEDRARLTELDEQAAALRAELAALEPPPAA